MEAGANEVCEHRTTRQSCSRALLSAAMHSGSGTTSDVSRHEPHGPKPAVAGRVSCPEGKTADTPPSVSVGSCRPGIRNLRKHDAREPGSGGASGGRMERQRQVAAGQRSSSSCTSVTGALARRVSITAVRASGSTTTRCAEHDDLPKLAEANSPAIEHAPPCAKQVEDERSKPTPRRTRVVERR